MEQIITVSFKILRKKSARCPCAAPDPGRRLNIKMIFLGMSIPIIKMRLSHNCLIFIMGIPILVRLHLYNETAPVNKLIVPERIQLHLWRPLSKTRRVCHWQDVLIWNCIKINHRIFQHVVKTKISIWDKTSDILYIAFEISISLFINLILPKYLYKKKRPFKKYWFSFQCFSVSSITCISDTKKFISFSYEITKKVH